MIFEFIRKIISYLMSVLIALTSAPVQGDFAVGADFADKWESDFSIVDKIKDFFGDNESNKLFNVLLEMNEVRAKYLGYQELTEEKISEIAAGMDIKTVLSAIDDIDALKPLTDKLSKKEKTELKNTKTAKDLSFLYLELDSAAGSSTMAANSNTVLGGSVMIIDSQGTGSVSNNTVTVTVKGGLLSGKTNTVDIYNNTAKAATLRFDYAASNYDTFSQSGSAGSYSVLLAPDANVTLTIKSKGGYETATLVLSNFSLVPAKENSDVTLAFESSAGDVTVNGEAVIPGAIKNISYASGATLVATSKTDSNFLAWVDAYDSKVLSTSQSYVIKPASDMTVKAVFVGKTATPYFFAGDSDYLFDDLNKAASFALSSGSKKVVLMNDGILPAGDYTIPAGVTFLIPFDDANTVYTTEPESNESYAKPVAYRTLTMASGASITVNGVLSLPAKHYAAIGSQANGGSPVGNCSFIKTESGSSITVNSGASLYAYGFITGSGKVVAKSGSSVYEYFQIMDFRGGSQTTDMENGVFPLSQYYIQNIEVPFTIESGAVESCYTSLRISGMTVGAAVAFIAKSDAMFNITSGSLTKYYDVNTDRLVIDVNGNLAISPIELKLGTGILATKINSKNYELPINGNITVNINSGTVTLAQDVALLPGSEINIGKNGACIISSNTNLYVYDSSDWGNFCGAGNRRFIPLTYAPGRKYNRTDADIKDAEICVDGLLDASSGYIYTTKSGANICSSGSGEARIKKGSQAVTHQLVQNTGYSEISLTAAKLKNADGTYKETTATVTSFYVNGKWVEHFAHSYTEKVTAQPDCEKQGSKTFTCICGHTYNESISALGHNPGAGATCETAQICQTCNKVLVLAYGHDYKSAVTAPTCTDKGFTTHTCSRCSHTYTDNEIAAKGHTAGAEATCTTNQICTVCGTELKGATGHNYKVTVVNPTCTENGYTTHECLNCGDSFTDNEIAAKGHTAGAEATCTKPQICIECGVKLKSENGHVPGNSATCTEAQLCVVCDEELTPALGHNMVHDETIEATCTEPGYSSGSRCLRCNHEEGKQIIPAKGHTAGAEATCTSSQKCTVCKAVIAPVKGHSYAVTFVSPTCSSMGYNKHVCSDCGNTYADNQTAPLGHKADGEANCTKAQTCTACKVVIVPAKGHTANEITSCTEAQTCTACGIELAPAKGHTPGLRATCMNAQTCTACGEELAPALEHKFIKTVTPVTCTSIGSTVLTCTRCRYQHIEAEIPATGHNMSAATCTEASKCLNEGCGYVEGLPLEHTLVTVEGMPAFCTYDGLTDGSYCSVCGNTIKEQEIIPALGHNLEYFEAKEPTFSSVGWEAYEDCTRCAYTTYKEIPKLETPTIYDYDSFIENLAILEEIANSYAAEVPGKDPVELIIKYIRTGVEKYNEGSWGIMAGYEDKDFAAYVDRIEDEFNSMEGITEFITVSALKNIELFELPNGDLVDFGHMFGSMDITYFNKKSLNHADVSGWAGDIVDLIEFSDYGGTDGTLEEMIAIVEKDYMLKDNPEEVGGFNLQDVYGDLDSFYLMRAIMASSYSEGQLTALFTEYYTESLTLETRADYFIKNRLDGVSTRQDIRNTVYNAYTGNKMITTLEATRDFKTSNLSDLRKACCYVFADYICKLAGDYVEITDNPYYTVFASESSTLAPGIIQSIKHATSADNKQMVYYTATADLSRSDVHVYANYKDNDPTEWGIQTVLAQANAAQNKYGNPESDKYIENYNVIASINASGYNMATGEPGSLLIMDGKEYHGPGAYGFFGITKEGKAVIGTTSEYNSTYRNQLKEAVGGFGTTLIIDGKISVDRTESYYTDRASRTAVGITRTGKVVFMVLDGRQEPVSCGGTMHEIAQIMFEAGCVEAINLDGGGSTTYVAKPEGEDAIRVVSRPSDGTSRSVSSTLMMVSTAPSSTAFDHAVITSNTDYLTKGASVQLTASGVSATGNAADIPEGAVWSVSDEKWGSITQDGLFTGLRNGSVDVNLTLNGEIIGTKAMNIVVPDRIYFTKSNIDAVYGARVQLPLVALYENKQVAVTENDVVFSLGNELAGSVEGFTFIGAEGTGIKSVTVYAALAEVADAKASVIVSLYNQGELSFDFDQAVGGDRTLAWYREVSNSTTQDNNLYEAINPDEAMITKYSFAIDMTQIPIPEQLADLTDMLPGAELENASAWTFLMQLAERVSVLTEVKPVMHFDSRFDVDYSEIKVVNDYFELTATEFDEAANALTMTLNWIDQTQAIDPEMANPICIVSGLKITPKADAEWTRDCLTPVNSGEISYKVYMRANALYSFAQKPENQQIYGIYPFVNPNNAKESGGYFGDVYATFEDSYKLSKAVKEGWVNEEGGFAYYINGEKLKGVNLVDGYYYDFGENGINVGQTKYTGIFFNEEKSLYHYSKLGELVSGWHMIGEDWYYFHSDTMAAKAGKYKVGTIEYEFEENGKLVSGVWMKCVFGYRYYYGPSFYKRGWEVIDGNRYYFYDSYRYEGIRCIQESNSKDFTWYDFGDDGICKDEVIPDGFYTDVDGSLSYVVNGIALKGLHKINGDYYLFDYYGDAVVGKKYASETYCDLPTGNYTFGDDHKALNGIVEIDGVLYYYENGKPKAKGLVEVDGEYYFAGGSNGEIIVDQAKYVWEGNGLLPVGTYEFDAEGKMLNGIVEKDGVLYYYENGKPKTKGLVEVNGAYYFAGGSNGEVTVSTEKYVWEGNGLLPEANYEFGADGKMLDGIVEKDGVLYYYVTGKPKQAGLLLIDGEYYFASGSKGELAVSVTKYVSQTNGLLPVGNYEFDGEGKMLDGIVEKDGVLYYYVTGKPKQAGLLLIDGEYYFASGSKGELAVSVTKYVSQTNGLLPVGNYEFDAEGKMLNGIVEKDSVLYYYETGKPKQAGLIELNGAYYFANGANGELTVNKTQYVWKPNGLLPEASYEFGADGKMLDGIVEKDGVLYYYVTGKPKQAGLLHIDGDYYFAGGASGELSVSKTQYVWQTNGLLPEKNYEFDENGKMLNGFFIKDGVRYYYVNGRPAPVGLTYIDGYYYFVNADGSLVVNKSYYVWQTNGLSAEMTYTFNELGQIVG